MRLNEGEILRSVFEFLDRVIDDYGLYLFVGLVHVAILLVAWVLCGGLRRRASKGRPMPQLPPIIVIPLSRPLPPPSETFDPFPPPHARPDCHCDDEHWD